MCLFSPNTDALIPLRSHATPDRAPDHLADGTPAGLRDDLIALLGHTPVRPRVTDLVKYATDASPYRFFPQVVIVAESVEQIAKTLQYAKQNHRSVTQRIALRREMMRQEPGSPVQKALLKEYEYDAVQTCTGDSSCEHACPVQINTGVLMKQFRHMEHGPIQEWVAARVAASWATVEPVARLALLAGNIGAAIFGDRTMRSILNLVRKFISPELRRGWTLCQCRPLPSCRVRSQKEQLRFTFPLA